MSASIVSLPMYDLPSLRWATEAWWAGIARALQAEGLAEVPDTLTVATSHDAPWRDPNLLLTQTCGYPLTHGFAAHLQPVAAIRWAIPECRGIEYHSVIVVRADDPVRSLADLRSRACAFNSLDSQSGMSALRHAVAPLARGPRFFGRVIQSFGHRASMAMVASGEADVCAVDVATFELVRRTTPEAVASLRVLARTAPAPGLPYATRIEADADLVRRLRVGLATAVTDPSLAEARGALLIAGVEPVERADYERIDAMEREAARLGYPDLA
ncbi:MAG: PhnD/SsuA/transferrin family substrate-binding protein [Alphaproteobacteria bacterium]